jgi:uncharacterized protein YqgV (UPF0045/DUF77 family)
MSVLVAFPATPLGAGERVGGIVAGAVRVVRGSGTAAGAGAAPS